MIFIPELSQVQYGLVAEALQVYVETYQRLRANEQQARFHQDLDQYAAAGRDMKEIIKQCRDTGATHPVLSNAQHILVLRAMRIYMNDRHQTIGQLWKTDRANSIELRKFLRGQVDSAMKVFDAINRCPRLSG